jgi:hypothetical protein
LNALWVGSGCAELISLIFVLIDEDDLLVKIFLKSLNLIKILFFFVFDILFVNIYFLFDFSFVLKNKILDLKFYLLISLLLIVFLPLIVCDDVLFQLLEVGLFLGDLLFQDGNLSVLFEKKLILFLFLHEAFDLIALCKISLLIVHFPFQSNLFPQYLILHLQNIILSLLNQLVPLFGLTLLYIKHLVYQLLHLLPLR